MRAPWCACRCRPNCATASPASRSRAKTRPARYCWLTSVGGRRPVGIAAAANTAGQPLLSENYYLERALGPFTEVRRGRASDLLKREIAVLVYADAGPDSPAEEEGIKKWVEAGGLLLRFAGTRLAEQSDHLLPVRLRRGGRTLGGALSWDKPAKLAPFAADTPFAGLAIPADVTVSRQVLAEPDIDLASKTWARLADGTPLVTAEKRGEGWVVLVHTTANAEWSNLALSGLFVEMLRRVVAMSQGVTAGGGGRSAAARDARRVRPAAACAANRQADRREGDRHRPAIAAPSAGVLRHRRFAARAEPVGRR